MVFRCSMMNAERRRKLLHSPKCVDEIEWDRVDAGRASTQLDTPLGHIGWYFYMVVRKLGDRESKIQQQGCWERELTMHVENFVEKIRYQYIPGMNLHGTSAR